LFSYKRHDIVMIFFMQKTSSIKGQGSIKKIGSESILEGKEYSNINVSKRVTKLVINT